MSKTIIWCGAGISIPSGMPAGFSLTWKWLETLLPDAAYAELVKLYTGYGKWLNSSVQRMETVVPAPRLEQVIEDAVKIFGTQVLDNLSFFKEVQPNPMHHMLARAGLSSDCLVVTTNFDDAIEKAANRRLNVHRLNTMGNCSETGLWKIHGCISEPNETLGHSIRNLLQGLKPTFDSTLRKLLQDPNNEIIFIGYSGSDSFDVNPFFLSIAKSIRARVTWIEHSRDTHEPQDLIPALFSSQKINLILRAAAFSIQRRVIQVNTETWLKSRFPQWASEFTPIYSNLKWQDFWLKWIPDDASKNLYAASVFATIGHGPKALNWALRAINTGISITTPQAERILLNGLRDCGMYAIEVKLRHKLQMSLPISAHDWNRARQYTASLFLARKEIFAIMEYRRLFKIVLSQRNIPDDVSEEIVWMLHDYGRFLCSVVRKIQSLPKLVGLIANYTVKAWLGGEIRLIHDYVLSRLKRHIHSPHIYAGFDEMLKDLAFAHMDKPTNHYIKRAVELDITPAMPHQDQLSQMTSEDLFQESNSMLGQANILRNSSERSVGWIPITTMRARDDLRAASILQFKKAYLLSRLIQDYIGMLKSLKILNELLPKDAPRWDRHSQRVRKCLDKRISEIGGEITTIQLA